MQLILYNEYCTHDYQPSNQATKQPSNQATKLLTRLFFNPLILVFIISLSLTMCSSGDGGASPSCDVNTLETDCDGDGYTNEEEKVCGTDPNDPTSTILGNQIDCDGDGVNNVDELACGSDPKDSASTILGNQIDCDGDGVNNGDELACATDPNDATSKPENPNDCDNDGVENADDVDDDNDGLIEILSLEMLYNIRYDLDGTHYDTDADDSTGKEGTNAGCLNNTCQGYELAQDLNFDENNNGLADDPYTMGLAWEPISASTQEVDLEFECLNSNANTWDTTAWRFSGSTSVLNCDDNAIALVHNTNSTISCGLATGTPLEWPASGTMNYKSKLTISSVSTKDINNITDLSLRCEDGGGSLQSPFKKWYNAR